MQQKMFMLEAIDSEGCKLYKDLDTLLRDAVKQHGQLTPDSKAKAKGYLEHSLPFPKDGTIFRAVSEVDGTRVSFLVYEATVQVK